MTALLYRTDFGAEIKSGKYLDSDIKHLTELKSVVRYSSGQMYQI